MTWGLTYYSRRVSCLGLEEEWSGTHSPSWGMRRTFPCWCVRLAVSWVDTIIKNWLSTQDVWRWRPGAEVVSYHPFSLGKEWEQREGVSLHNPSLSLLASQDSDYLGEFLFPKLTTATWESQCAGDFWVLSCSLYPKPKKRTQRLWGKDAPEEETN